ncbi:MAG: DUF896 domain-containing protein [Syntrophomonadaceae bacterium]|nr:DUF896 domain-containing protein [Syntrophomonadaceae bacterium]
MISKELIERINYLARKSKTEGLTPEEKEEQARVRRQYLDAIKARVTDALDRVKIVDQKPTECSCDCLHLGPCSQHKTRH